VTDTRTTAGDEEARRAAVAALSGGEEALEQLVEALGDESWRVRKEAAARAASWADRTRAVAALLRALGEPENVGRRNAAVEGLVKVGAEAVETLVGALAGRPEHRKVIIDTLGLIGDRRAATALAPFVDDPDLNVRAAVGEALGLIGGPDAEAALARGLDKGQALLSLACLEALNRLGAVLPVVRLERLAVTKVLRPSALVALGNSRDPAAARHLVAALLDRSRAVREAATGALATLFEAFSDRSDEAARSAVIETVRALPDGAEPMLVLELLEAGPASRRAAATVLGLTVRASAARPLMLALADGEVAETAALALSRIGTAAVAPLAAMAPGVDSTLRAAVFRILPSLAGGATPDGRIAAVLVDGLGDDDGEAASQAARSLGVLGGEAALPALAEALVRPDTAAAAAEALARLGTGFPDAVRALVRARGFLGPEAPHLCRVLGTCAGLDDVPLLLGLLHADSPPLRAAAAEALAAVPVADGVEDALCYALTDEAPEVREAAARSLARSDSARAIDALHGAAADDDALVRAAAVQALGARRSPAARETLRTLARSTDGAVAVHAIEALVRGRIAGEEEAPTTEVLLVALGHQDVEVVKAAAAALAALHPSGAVLPSEALAGLERALFHPRWDVRRAAAAALAEIGGERSLSALRARSAVEDDALVRDAIAAALAAGRENEG
jgi:HEAT repeat protein